MHQEALQFATFECPGFETEAAVERARHDRTLGWDRPDSERAPSLGLALATELARLLAPAGVMVKLDVEYYAIRLLLERGAVNAPMQLSSSDGESWSIGSFWLRQDWDLLDELAAAIRALPGVSEIEWWKERPASANP